MKNAPPKLLQQIEKETRKKKHSIIFADKF